MNKIDLDDPIAVKEFLDKKNQQNKKKTAHRNEDGILVLPTAYAKCGGAAYIRWSKEMWCNDISMKNKKKKKKRNGWNKQKRKLQKLKKTT